MAKREGWDADAAHEKRGKGGRAAVIWAALSLLAIGIALLALLRAGVFSRTAEDSDTPASVRGVKTVGTDIALADMTEFYYTTASSAFPPDYQRYHFYAENGACFFYHETREGTHFPLSEADITRSGTRELSPEDWAALFDLLTGGTVKKRSESADAGGSGPWLYLYWSGDRSKYQEYTFPSREAASAFEALCLRLREQAEAAIK